MSKVGSSRCVESQDFNGCERLGEGIHWVQKVRSLKGVEGEDFKEWKVRSCKAKNIVLVAFSLSIMET